MCFLLLGLCSRGVAPGIWKEREDLISCHPHLFPWPQKKGICESWWRMLLPASPSTGQTGAVGRSPCHSLYIPLVRSRPEKRVCQQRAEEKATPGKCFKGGAASRGLYPHEISGRTSPAQTIQARKPCPNETLRRRGGNRDPSTRKQLPPTGSQGMLSDQLAGKFSLLWSSREMPSPRHAWCAPTTVNLLKEEENGLTNLWSLSLTSAADTAGGTRKPNGFIYLSVLILAQIGKKQMDKGQEIPQL